MIIVTPYCSTVPKVDSTATRCTLRIYVVRQVAQQPLRLGPPVPDDGSNRIITSADRVGTLSRRFSQVEKQGNDDLFNLDTARKTDVLKTSHYRQIIDVT